MSGNNIYVWIMQCSLNTRRLNPLSSLVVDQNLNPETILFAVFISQKTLPKSNQIFASLKQSAIICYYCVHKKDIEASEDTQIKKHPVSLDNCV